MAREPIPKSVRFEVFKRDKFSCQYCGKSAPEVILEVDHIVPVSKGGKNEILNLVTACRDCNMGKSNREISDDAAVVKQKQQLDELQDRREQLEMMLKWRESLSDTLDAEVDSIVSIFVKNTYWTPTAEDRRLFRKLIRQFGFNEVYTSSELALDTYFNNQYEEYKKALSKIGGICYNRKKAREGDA